MNARDFLYWLSGFLEDTRTKALDETQVRILREHLALVVTKVTSDPAKLPVEPTPDLLKQVLESQPKPTIGQRSFVRPLGLRWDDDNGTLIC